MSHNNLLYVHTPKALRYDLPSGRLFLVTEKCLKDTPHNFKGELIAWKCVITKKGIKHPGYKKMLSLSEIRQGKGRNSKYRNGAEATAVFKPDSFYKQISFEDLEALIKASKTDTVSSEHAKAVRLFKEANAKLSQEERQAIRYVLNNSEMRIQYANEW